MLQHEYSHRHASCTWFVTATREGFCWKLSTQGVLPSPAVQSTERRVRLRSGLLGQQCMGFTACRMQSTDHQSCLATHRVLGTDCTVQITHSFQLSGGGAAYPREVLGGKASTQHLPKHSRKAGVARVVGKEVGALPMRKACIHRSIAVQCNVVVMCQS